MFTCPVSGYLPLHSYTSPAAPPIDILNNVEGIDNWSIVAEKVSDQSYTKRIPDECRIQWVGNLHPKVNYGEWTSEALNKLHDLTANENLRRVAKIDWTRVVQDLGVSFTLYVIHLDF
jgi:hypothetical protein